MKFGAAIAFAFLLTSSVRAATLYDPLLRFRRLPTEHFIIYFHQGEDDLARRLAAIAEDTWRALQQPFGITPPKRTHVVLVDQTELANGWASTIPYDTIMVTAAWPASSEFIGNTDDWLRLVFAHEFTHIVHLDRSESWARVIRRIFGRSELAFPNLFLPQWQIEGLATYQESAQTGEGRLHAGDFASIVDEAARGRALEPLDRVNGGLTDWPDGDGAYAYGSRFHRYLADRFGAESLGQLAEATAGRFPWTGSRVFPRIFGESLGDLWRDFEASLTETAERAAAATPVEADSSIRRLTGGEYFVSGPRFDRPACPTCPSEVVYARRSPEGFPTLNRVALDGSEPREITRRYRGSTTAIGVFDLVFDQQEVRRNTGVYSDLYAWSRASRTTRRFTFEQRLQDPDLSPDGNRIVCVQSRPGRRDLVTVSPLASKGRPLTRIDTILSEADTQFNAPRWSPDGRSIAVERHRPGASSEIVVVDVATKATRVIAPASLGRSVTPTWRRDGQAIVAAVAPDEQPFNLVEFRLDGALPRQLTATTGGATWPDISPDGRTIVFVGYTVDGFDLFTTPYQASGLRFEGLGLTAQSSEQPQSASPQSDSPQSDSPQSTSPQPLALSPTQPVSTYSPWPTLPPTSWLPIVEGDSTHFRAGAATSGTDVLGYHAYTASATWLVSGPDDAIRPNAATPDWNIYYAYSRWRPTLFVNASNDTSFFSGPPTDAGTPTSATLREREVEAGVLFPIRHVRASHLAFFSTVAAADRFMRPADDFTRDRVAVRGAWATTTARVYGNSISPEGGVSVGATAEAVPEALASFGSAQAFTADARAYLPGFAPHHVVALRAAAGTSSGDPDVRRTFHLGGAAPAGGAIDFDRSAISLLRGFPADTFAGRNVALINADYRFPIARPQRGHGTWPFFIHSVHGAVFADAGHAWTRAFDADAVKTSIGGEISARFVAGYFLPLTITVGVARGHDGSHTVSDRTTFYARIGYAF